VTGLFLDQPLIAGKWLEILKGVLPSIERVALIWDPNSGTDQLRAAQDAARVIGVSTIVLEVRRTDGYDVAFESLNGHEGTGVVQLGTPVLTAPAAALGAAAAKYRLPTISFYTPHVRAGALIGYGPDLQTYFPRAAAMADKIVKGASPADLPIEQPTKFELVVNLKTARSLGITIPPILHARADEVIERALFRKSCCRCSGRKLAPFHRGGLAAQQKHSESRPSGDGASDPVQTSAASIAATQHFPPNRDGTAFVRL